MQITVSVNPITASNTYIAGQLVRLNIPFGYGMQQANGLIPQITNVSGSTITVNVDSTLFDAFSVPISGERPASLSPAGSKNLSFSNVTSQIAFQSLNNIGN
jgi:hypothetical protein